MAASPTQDQVVSHRPGIEGAARDAALAELVRGLPDAVLAELFRNLATAPLRRAL
jgi:hypothetical protein